MKYYRCKCGHSTAWSSMGVSNCSTCSECGSTYAQHPGFHPEPKDHDWMKQYDQNTGEPYLICRNCHERKDKAIASE